MPKIVSQNKKLPPAKAGSAASRIVSIRDVQHDGIKMAIYGHSGTGKTRLAASFAKLGPLLHMVCSSNGVNECRSIMGTKNVDVVEIREPSDLPELIQVARSRKYVTVVLDHVTDYCDLVLARILKLERLPEQSSWGMADLKEYQQQGLQAKNYLRELIDLDCNVILTGQERVYKEAKDEEGETIMPYVSIASTPGVAGWISPTVDYIGRTFKRTKVLIEEKKMGDKTVTIRTVTKDKEYCFLVGPSTVYTTKFRVPPGTELPDVVVDPTYDKLSQLINPEE